MNYHFEYYDLEITYHIEGDCDGNHAIITCIAGSNIGDIDADTIKDIKFQCECEYADLQSETYMKTGELI